MRLAAFNLPQINRLTMVDELHLDEMGEKKSGIVLLHPPIRTRASTIWSAWCTPSSSRRSTVRPTASTRGALPVPVHCLMDEFPNISLPKDSFLSAAGYDAQPRVFFVRSSYRTYRS